MKSLFISCAATILTTFSLGAAETQYDAQLTKKILTVLNEFHQIKPGMTRADLLKFFTTEGGVSFQPVGEETQWDESPADKITKISEPFLAYGILD